MTTWLLRREKVMRHDLFVKWRLAGSPAIQDIQQLQPITHLKINIARTPNAKAVSFADASRLYGADEFRKRLAEYIVEWNNPEWSAARVKRIAAGYTFHFKSVAAFNKVKFWRPDAQGRDDAPETLDSIHVRPAYRDTLRRLRPARFDTALVRDREVEEGHSPARGYRVVQVRIVFKLSKTAALSAFPNATPARPPPEHLAYVEWFSRFPNVADANHAMYRVHHLYDGNYRHSSIIPASQLDMPSNDSQAMPSNSVHVALPRPGKLELRYFPEIDPLTGEPIPLFVEITRSQLAQSEPHADSRPPPDGPDGGASDSMRHERVKSEPRSLSHVRSSPQSNSDGAGGVPGATPRRESSQLVPQAEIAPAREDASIGSSSMSDTQLAGTQHTFFSGSSQSYTEPDSDVRRRRGFASPGGFVLPAECRLPIECSPRDARSDALASADALEGPRQCK
ncbi:hypothetical protein FA95DRAFT_1577295 [Auriscalpium vulgare]|uniref:Uncharacterized protein n=1 Tax=Auriscalpium vulgare TaxID=40419 RepID=A0ACB8R6Y2_9AGAM|nr:hypothetical protein FA95DRAFT_1577295 [Auriscalpium vulgare]